MGTRDITAKWKVHKDILIRGAGFGVAVAAVCGALAAGSVLRGASRALSQAPAAAVEQDAKDQTRVAAGERSSATQAAAITNVTIWHPGKMESAPPDQVILRPSLAHADLGGEWRQQEFTFVAVVDGRTFSSGGLTIRLDGLDLPSPDQVCRTLDNRLEQCVTRAATQLELLTRSRSLACRYRMTTSSEAVGSCRIGALDLAERMVRTGYVRATAPGRSVIASASRIEAGPR